MSFPPTARWVVVISLGEHLKTDKYFTIQFVKSFFKSEDKVKNKNIPLRVLEKKV